MLTIYYTTSRSKQNLSLPMGVAFQDCKKNLLRCILWRMAATTRDPSGILRSMLGRNASVGGVCWMPHAGMNPGVANFTRGYLKDISFIELTRALIST